MLRPKLEELALQAQGVSIFAIGEYLATPMSAPSWQVFFVVG